MSNSVRPHRWQTTRLPRPWDSPGKNTGVECHCLLLNKLVIAKIKKLTLIGFLSEHISWSCCLLLLNFTESLLFWKLQLFSYPLPFLLLFCPLVLLAFPTPLIALCFNPAEGFVVAVVSCSEKIHSSAWNSGFPPWPAANSLPPFSFV